MLHVRHEHREYDQYLADVALVFLEEMIWHQPYEQLKETRRAFNELQQHAYNISLQNDFLSS